MLSDTNEMGNTTSGQAGSEQLQTAVKAVDSAVKEQYRQVELLNQTCSKLRKESEVMKSKSEELGTQYKECKNSLSVLRTRDKNLHSAVAKNRGSNIQESGNSRNRQNVNERSQKTEY
jgi:hypothetical protein